MKKKRVVYGVAVGCLLLIAFFAVKRALKPKVFLDVIASKPVVEIGMPEKGDIRKYTDLTGTVKSGEEVSVFPKTAGEVTEVLVKVGDKVGVGDVLCRLDVETSLKSLKTALDSAELSLTQAKTNYERQKALYDSGNLSTQQYEAARDAVTGAELQYNNAKTNYENLVEYSVITAPIDGIISTCNINAHDMVANQTPICVITDEGQKDIVFNTTKGIRDYLSMGQDVQVFKSGESYNAKIYEIGTKVEQSGMFKIKAALDESANDLFATGETVKLNLETDSAEGVIKIPLDSVYFDKGLAYAYIYDSGKLQKKELETGLSDNTEIEVKSGISMNDNILTTWTSELGDGTEVDVK